MVVKFSHVNVEMHVSVGISMFHTKYLYINCIDKFRTDRLVETHDLQSIRLTIGVIDVFVFVIV